MGDIAGFVYTFLLVFRVKYFRSISTGSYTAWGELSVASSKSLQGLENCSACIVQRRDSFRDSFNTLGWVDLETNPKVHKCILAF